jgi:hypothetical protein
MAKKPKPAPKRSASKPKPKPKAKLKKSAAPGPAPVQFSDLAARILAVHRANPHDRSYASQSIRDRYSLGEMDAAYAELLEAGAVQPDGQGRMAVHGVPRQGYKLKPQAPGLGIYVN